MTQFATFAPHEFTSFNDITFSPRSYSFLKFGSDLAAKQMGYELAATFFAKHSAELMAMPSVVIPSPYNHVKNAATIMTEHFINRLNGLLVCANGTHLDSSIIHRKVSYTNDYGFLSKEKRRTLIDNDNFFINREFIKGKRLIFIDDVRITGTHEEKLIEVLQKRKIKNPTFFLYFASYNGQSPHIEAELNFAGINGVDEFIQLMKEPDHHVIVRPIKYLLSLSDQELKKVFKNATTKFITAMYHGCLGEGYYKIPSYQKNFELLTTHYQQLHT